MNLGHFNRFQRKALLSIPLWGFVLFSLMYIIAAYLYPGGSADDPVSKGFSIRHNYWCNLLNDPAINGEPNPGKIFAIAGMVFLSSGLIVFWYSLPVFLNGSKLIGKALRFSAALTAVFIGLLPGPWSHDMITNLASGTGLIAVICTLILLKNCHWWFLFSFGIVNILLVALNNYFYYSTDLIRYLPVLQKVSFLSFIMWLVAIVIRIRQNSI